MSWNGQNLPWSKAHWPASAALGESAVMMGKSRQTTWILSPYLWRTCWSTPALYHAWHDGQPKSPYSMSVTGALAGPMEGSVARRAAGSAGAALPRCQSSSALSGAGEPPARALRVQFYDSPLAHP